MITHGDRDATETLLAGAEHDDAQGDLAWAYAQPHGSATVRALGYALRKTLRRCTAGVTFDRPSFERAVAAAPPGSLFVLVPSHRSYFDFLLMSYLCFQHPELGLPLPHIAAAEEFSRIAVVGRVLREAQAFYIRRGAGKESPELNEELRRLAAMGGSLMFFIEGQRSRSRLTLAPKRGLLRGLQATGQTFTVLPIGISYDRLPEERSLEEELRGAAKPRMSLRALLGWLARLARGDLQLGRIHLACGEPARMDPTTGIAELAQHLVAEQQRHTLPSRFHLRAFLSHAQPPGVSEPWLVSAIQRRGGRVLDSELPLPRGPYPALQQCLRNQWAHWFYRDALELFPGNVAVLDHVRRHRFAELPGSGELAREGSSDTSDPRLRRTVEALLLPVVLDYELVVRCLGAPSPDRKLPFPTPRALVNAYPVAHLPHLVNAYRALAERGILREVSPDSFTWGTESAALPGFMAAVTAGFAVKRSRRSSATARRAQHGARSRADGRP